MRATSAEAALEGGLLEPEVLVAALEQLQHDIAPATDKGAPAAPPSLACTACGCTPVASPALHCCVMSEGRACSSVLECETA